MKGSTSLETYEERLIETHHEEETLLFILVSQTEKQTNKNKQGQKTVKAATRKRYWSKRKTHHEKTLVVQPLLQTAIRVQRGGLPRPSGHDEKVCLRFPACPSVHLLAHDKAGGVDVFGVEVDAAAVRVNGYADLLEFLEEAVAESVGEREGRGRHELLRGHQSDVFVREFFLNFSGCLDADRPASHDEDVRGRLDVRVGLLENRGLLRRCFGTAARADYEQRHGGKGDWQGCNCWLKRDNLPVYGAQSARFVGYKMLAIKPMVLSQHVLLVTRCWL